MFEHSVLEYVAIVLLALLAYCVLISLIKFVYKFFIGPAIFKVNFKSKGKWAMVTGCTDGIGKEYARQLAAHGCNIILISRSIGKLHNIAAEIEQEFKVATKVIKIDFYEDNDISEKISREIFGLDIGTLVNNVGVAYRYPDYFLDVADWERTMSMIIKVNMESVIRMTNLVLPQMINKGKGVIINVGAMSSIIPNPMLSAFAASKVFIQKFSEDLIIDYSKKGIIIQCVMPGYVVTQSSGLTKSTLTAPTAKTFVKSALSVLRTASVTTGYVPHEMMANLINLIFNISNTIGESLIIKNMEESRERAIKRINV